MYVNSSLFSLIQTWWLCVAEKAGGGEVSQATGRSISVYDEKHATVSVKEERQEEKVTGRHNQNILYSIFWVMGLGNFYEQAFICDIVGEGWRQL